MSYIDSLNPDGLEEYKARAKELLNNATGGVLEKVEAVTNSALGAGLALHHAGILGKNGLFSDASKAAKNVKQAGQDALNSAKQKVQGIADEAGQKLQGVADEAGQRLGGMQGEAENLLSRVASRSQPAEADSNMFEGAVFRNAAYDPSSLDEETIPTEQSTGDIARTGNISSGDMAELRSADPQQVSRILNGDPTELGEGMSDRLFDRLLQTRQTLVKTGRTLQTSTDNIYSHSAGDAINQARLNGELQGAERPSEPTEPAQTNTQLQEPGSTSNANDIGQAGIKNNVGTEDDIATQGEEALEQGGEQTLKETAGTLAKTAAGDTLDELTAGSTVLDETPVGDIITAGLGIASLFETIFGLVDSGRQKAAPVVQSGQQVGVS